MLKYYPHLIFHLLLYAFVGTETLDDAGKDYHVLPRVFKVLFSTRIKITAPITVGAGKES